MTQAHVVRLSADEYLRSVGERYEFVRGQLFNLVDGTDTRSLFALDIASALREQLRDRPYRVFMADMKLRVQFAYQHST